MAEAEQFLVLECFEEETGFLRFSQKIFADELRLCEELGVPHSQRLFEKPLELNREAILRLRQIYGVKIDENESWCTVRRPIKIDFLPYEVHTSREFDLMRRGLKPLAVFSESVHADQSIMNAIAARFKELIESSDFVERRYTWLLNGSHDAKKSAASVLMIARRAEEWRIDAHILMVSCAFQSGWSDSFERLEGSLLGYESWQTDAYLQLKNHTK